MESICVLWNIGTDKNRRLMWWNIEGTELTPATRDLVLLEGVLCCKWLLTYVKSTCSPQFFKSENKLKFLRSLDGA